MKNTYSEQEKNIIDLLNKLMDQKNIEVVKNFFVKKGIELVSNEIKNLPLPARQLLSEFIRIKK